MSNTGWVCPRCSRVYSPSTSMCSACQPSYVTPYVPYTPYYPTYPTYPMYPTYYQITCGDSTSGTMSSGSVTYTNTNFTV